MKNKIGIDHPVNMLYMAANKIVQSANFAFKETGQKHEQLSIPIWVDSDPVIKITIECGVETETEYVIFKAQNT